MAFLPSPEEGPGVSFDEMYEAWYKLATLEAALQTIEDTLDRCRALCKLQATVAPEFWVHGKAPTAEWLKQVVHYVGNTPADRETLKELEESAVKLNEAVTRAKGNLDVLQTQIRCWQTNSANMRKILALE